MAETGSRQSKTNFYDRRHETPTVEALKSALVSHSEASPGFPKAVFKLVTLVF